MREITRLKQLADERRLKQTVDELTLDTTALKNVLAKKTPSVATSKPLAPVL